jgi:hypothetical protein
MTSNRTIKRTLLVATTLAGMAWMTNAHADDGSRNTSGERTVSIQPTVPARGERSFDLRDYGDRFKLAIEAIKKEAQKPAWTWEDCEHDSRVARKD